MQALQNRPAAAQLPKARSSRVQPFTNQRLVNVRVKVRLLLLFVLGGPVCPTTNHSQHVTHSQAWFLAQSKSPALRHFFDNFAFHPKAFCTSGLHKHACEHMPCTISGRSLASHCW